MVLLIDAGDLDQWRIQAALDKTFSGRKTHELPKQVPHPPDNWAGPFQAMARECQIDEDLHAAFENLRDFIERIVWK